MLSKITRYLMENERGLLPDDSLTDSMIARLAAWFGLGGSLLTFLMFTGAGVFSVAAVSVAGAAGYGLSLLFERTGYNRLSRLWTGAVFLAEVEGVLALASIQSGFHIFVLTGLPMSQVLFGKNERKLKILAVLCCAVLFVPVLAGRFRYPLVPIDTYWLRMSTIFSALTVFIGFAFILFRFTSLLRNAEAVQRERATVDELTGLWTRRHFLARSETMMEVASRYGRKLAILILDIDHFKSINDRFGHLAGDTVLRDVSGEIRRRIRRSDVAGRFGGEEFVILLPETDNEQAAVVAESIRAGVEGLQPRIAGTNLDVTVSIGISGLNTEDPVDFQKILDQADQALYAAKETGRNRVVAFGRQ